MEEQQPSKFSTFLQGSFKGAKLTSIILGLSYAVASITGLMPVMSFGAMAGMVITTGLFGGVMATQKQGEEAAPRPTSARSQAPRAASGNAPAQDRSPEQTRATGQWTERVGTRNTERTSFVAAEASRRAQAQATGRSAS